MSRPTITRFDQSTIPVMAGTTIAVPIADAIGIMTLPRFRKDTG